MMLNRSSFWLAKNGENIQIKRMTLCEMQCALDQLADLELDERYQDPYVLGILCHDTNTCNILPEPTHTINGHSLEEWHNFLVEQISRRVKFLTNYPKNKTSFMGQLANTIKFW